jgi:DNA-directed RNA polymerase specialized sigma24 family protein
VLRVVRNRQTGEDVLQESMVKGWFSIGSYDAEISWLFTWAARICCNTAIDHLRTGRARLVAQSATLGDTPAMHYAAPVEFYPEHIGVADLLLNLRPEYRRVIDLLYLQDFAGRSRRRTARAREHRESLGWPGPPPAGPAAAGASAGGLLAACRAA